MLMVAGCISETSKTAVVPTSTVIATVTQTQAPVVAEIVVSEPAEVKEMGTVVVTLPAIGEGATIRTRQAQVTIYGSSVGTMTSSAPLEFKVPIGTHQLGVSGFRDRTIDVAFGKRTIVVLIASNAVSNNEDHAITDKATADTLMEFTGTGDSVHIVNIKDGGLHIIGAVARATSKYGSDNFIVTFESDDGTEYIFNEIAAPTYSGTKTLKLPIGTYVMSVQGGCSYTIIITK